MNSIKIVVPPKEQGIEIKEMLKMVSPPGLKSTKPKPPAPATAPPRKESVDSGDSGEEQKRV